MITPKKQETRDDDIGFLAFRDELRQGDRDGEASK